MTMQLPILTLGVYSGLHYIYMDFFLVVLHTDGLIFVQQGDSQMLHSLIFFGRGRGELRVWSSMFNNCMC